MKIATAILCAAFALGALLYLAGCDTAQAHARDRTLATPSPVKRLHKIYWSGRGDWEAARPTWTYPLEQNGKIIQPTSP